MPMVLLIFPNTSPFPYHAMTPLAIYAVGTYLETKGINVEYYDERVQSKQKLEEILDKGPEIIGVSALTSFQILRGLALTKYVKRRCPETPVVWGGIHPTMCPEQTLKEPMIDYVVINEGEETLYELFQHLNSGSQNLNTIAGLGWKDQNGKMYINQERQFLDMEKVPFTFQGKAKEHLPFYIKSNGFPTVGYQMSRGCHCRCRFCYNTFYHKEICRNKPPDVIKKELESLISLGVNNIHFIDDSMGGKRSFLYELASILEELPLKWSGSPRINYMNEELVSRFEKNGCQWLFFGLESPLDNILKYIGKDMKIKHIEKGVEVMRSSSIISTYSLMVGFPKETYQESLDVLTFADKLIALHPSAEVAIQPYAPLPGSDLYEEAKEKGFKPPSSLIDWSYFTMDKIHTPWLRNRPLFKNVYLISFLAFRYKHKLGDLKQFRWVFYLVHLTARFRWRYRWFGFYIEGLGYSVYTKWKFWRAARR